jgi:hypothetical protein
MTPDDIADLPLPWHSHAVEVFLDQWLREHGIDPEAFWEQVEREERERRPAS